MPERSTLFAVFIDYDNVLWSLMTVGILHAVQRLISKGGVL
jgi:hypothetical protein